MATIEEKCGSISPKDGLRTNAVCVRPKGHSHANGLGDYHGTEQDIHTSEGGYYWHDYPANLPPAETPSAPPEGKSEPDTFEALDLALAEEMKQARCPYCNAPIVMNRVGFVHADRRDAQICSGKPQDEPKRPECKFMAGRETWKQAEAYMDYLEGRVRELEEDRVRLLGSIIDSIDMAPNDDPLPSIREDVMRHIEKAANHE